ncbi:MAG: hypothetical protein Fur0018_20670 [Anaerolineales bacterium]
MNDWHVDFSREIESAQAARAQGNEGRARVCARRAAGLVLSAYFAAQGIAFNRPSAYDKLRFFAALPTAPPAAREVAQHFLVRVTPEYHLPLEADLIAEAEWLRQVLFPSQTDGG